METFQEQLENQIIAQLIRFQTIYFIHVFHQKRVMDQLVKKNIYVKNLQKIKRNVMTYQPQGLINYVFLIHKKEIINLVLKNIYAKVLAKMMI